MHEKNSKRGLIDLSRPVGPSRMHTRRSKRAKEFIARKCRRAQPMQFISTLLGACPRDSNRQTQFERVQDRPMI